MGYQNDRYGELIATIANANEVEKKIERIWYELGIYLFNAEEFYGQNIEYGMEWISNKNFSNIDISDEKNENSPKNYIRKRFEMA